MRLSPVTSDLRLDPNGQNEERVSAASNGSTMVFVWRDNIIASPVRARMIDSMGIPLSGVVQINESVGEGASDLSVSINSQAECAFTWNGFDDTIKVITFDSSMSPLAPIVEMDAPVEVLRRFPQVHHIDDQHLGVIWLESATTPGVFFVYYQQIGSDGAPRGLPIRINQYVPPYDGVHYGPPRTAYVGNLGLAVWAPFEMDGDNHAIAARSFDASSLALGPELVVNQYTYGIQNEPTLASTPDGRFIVVWTSALQDGQVSGVYGRILDATDVTSPPLPP